MMAAIQVMQLLSLDSTVKWRNGTSLHQHLIRVAACEWRIVMKKCAEDR